MKKEYNKRSAREILTCGTRQLDRADKASAIRTFKGFLQRKDASKEQKWVFLREIIKYWNPIPKTVIPLCVKDRLYIQNRRMIELWTVSFDLNELYGVRDYFREIMNSITPIEFLQSHFNSGTQCTSGIAIQCYFLNLVRDQKMTLDQRKLLLERSPVNVASKWDFTSGLDNDEMTFDGWCALQCACPLVPLDGGHIGLFRRMDRIGLTPFGALLIALEVYFGRTNAMIAIPFLKKYAHEYRAILTFVTSIGVSFGHVAIPVKRNSLWSLQDLAAAKLMHVIGKTGIPEGREGAMQVFNNNYKTYHQCQNCQSYSHTLYDYWKEPKEKIIEKISTDKELKKVFDPVELKLIKVCGFC
jgi:hypothetical protein